MHLPSVLKGHKDKNDEDVKEAKSESTSSNAGQSQQPASEQQGGDQPLSKSALKKKMKEEEKARLKAEKEAKVAAERKAAAEAQEQEEANDFAKQYYGKVPLNRSQDRPRRKHDILTDLPSKVGETVLLRARIQTSRPTAKNVFFLLRQKIDTVQAILSVKPGQVSKPMFKWGSQLGSESIVLVEGVVEKALQEVKSATIGAVEIHITQIHLVAEPEKLFFSLEDASAPEKPGGGDDDQEEYNEEEHEGAEKEDNEEGDKSRNNVLLRTRLDHRILDLRTTTNQAIFKLQAAISDLFREFLNSQGFVEIHSPKLQGAATESGASVFKVSYFKGEAFLAQSPQLAKQMAIAADFERVYEIGPVFRAEKSFTHRHLTEFMGLDLEMVIEEHYHEVMELLDQLFLFIFRSLKQKFSKEIETVGTQFHCEEFKWRDGPEGTLKLTYTQAVDLLVEDGVDRSEVIDDMDTTNEKRLGRIIKAKYDTDYYIIDKFPLEVRPFYTMPDPSNPGFCNAYDFFIRGEEVLSGGQRIHDPVFLAEQMKKKGVDPESMSGYMEGFKLGCPPHGGGGIGLERVLMLYLKLNNIRRATLFPRDPNRLTP